MYWQADGWIDGLIGKWEDLWIAWLTDRQFDWLKGWLIDGWIDGWIGEQTTDGQTDEEEINGWTVGLMKGWWIGRWID